MIQEQLMTTAGVRDVEIRDNYESIAWRWMRYSGILLIPLAWGHMLIQDVLVGAHRIDLSYVQMRWSITGWRVYDFLLLGLAFAHGMNGLRQVLFDFLPAPRTRRWLSWSLFVLWLAVTLVGAVAIIGGVRMP
jgi:succinate dehydrogenase / fumarate reductase membrane anchor subunit